jgi:hypothetical protein
MATIDDVIKKALQDREFLAEFLRNQDSALGKFKLNLSEKDRETLKRALESSHQVTGLDLLKVIRRVLEGPSVPTPPPPPWDMYPDPPYEKMRGKGGDTA